MEIQQDFEKIQEACPVCKAGINWYIRMDGKLHHVDFFYSFDDNFGDLEFHLIN
uniref:Uncharacterized protein n=1 Tax=Marseillevirus LCMAC101 TaxID=2506602 RepID=A0A481YSI1_9VIRU|nr:MAG: hypothetical protein LCMAC101_05120 [Marseillevirus LCMAC101]